MPFISTETIDEVLNVYLDSDKDALSVVVPVEVFDDLGLNYSYEYNGCVPSGLNVLRSENIVQDEKQLMLKKVELALNINTILDSKIAEKYYNRYYINGNDQTVYISVESLVTNGYLDEVKDKYNNDCTGYATILINGTTQSYLSCKYYKTPGYNEEYDY